MHFARFALPLTLGRRYSRLEKLKIDLVFRSLNRTFNLRLKVGCTSEMKRKKFFSFAFRSVCTTFAERNESME